MKISCVHLPNPGLLAVAAAICIGLAPPLATAGAPSHPQDCAAYKQDYDRSRNGNGPIPAQVAAAAYMQCMKDHRYDGGVTRPGEGSHHACGQTGSCN
jgi:hypothetical protein